MTTKFSFRADTVVRRTYNRPLNEEGTVFETWTQTVDRVIMHQRWLWSRAQNAELSAAQEEELAELRELYIARKAMPAGRTLWLGGTDVGRERESTQFNPFVAGTELMTREYGLVPIESLQGKTFNVVGSDGNYHPAIGSYSGKQETRKIRFYRGRQEVFVTASINHRWWTEDGRRITTDEIEKGVRIPFVRPNKTQSDPRGFLHGVMFGDGTIARQGDAAWYRVRLCGGKNALLDALAPFATGVSHPPSCGGDAVVYFGNVLNHEHDLKALPPENCSTEYVAGFLEGLLATDGQRDGGKISGDAATIDYVERYAHLIGCVTGSRQNYSADTNYGPRSKPLHTLILVTSEMSWYAEIISDEGVQDVWCCTVPGEESFTLKHGILTSNCAYTNFETVYDAVDILWLLLQGCGVGFRPIVGTLTGFGHRIPSLEIIRSTATAKTGIDDNKESFDPNTGVWTIRVGDSAVAWARFFGKLLVGKYRATKLIVDFSNIRPAGTRLKGYGWLSSGDVAIARATEGVFKVLNSKAGTHLSRIDILDIGNWMGTILSSRRSAEIAILAHGEEEWEEFAKAKKEFWVANVQRAQSNNSLLFYKKPERDELKRVFDMMLEAGGSEPGFINMEQAIKRAPWAQGMNPCAEILLANKSFCNLTTNNVASYKDDHAGLERAAYLTGRANYRQTCVDLRDGVLQEAWHVNNDFLRLCGVSLTGIAQRTDLKPYDFMKLRRSAHHGAYSMADELRMPRPKNVTTIKPEGTQSKCMDATEGMHKPLGRYVFNNVNFSRHDPIVAKARGAGYRVFDNPTDQQNVLITFPVEFSGVAFDRVNGVEVNTDSAVSQLERYRMLMESWCDQNVSATISYSPEEVEAIIDWLLSNWDSYVGVSFLFRADPTKTAKDLGYLYLPQEVVTKEAFDTYVAQLQPVDLDASNSLEMIDVEDCVGGVCPVR